MAADLFLWHTVSCVCQNCLGWDQLLDAITLHGLERGYRFFKTPPPEHWMPLAQPGRKHLSWAP